MMSLSKQTALLTTASLLALAATGCGIGSGGVVSSPVVAPLAVTTSGRVMGGQQPVGGVTLQLYAVGTGGYGSAATPLFTAGAVKTTAAGNFTFPSTINCPTPGSLVYLVGTGGQPIAAANGNPATTNLNLSMMVGLGACSTVGSNFIDMNELTTVATVWALSPFMSSITNIGSSSTNTVGIANAFATINQLVNTTNGTLSGPALPGNATLPTSEINTLADMLEQCVNSGGGVATDTTDGVSNGTPCGKLFYLTTVNSVAPTDTVTAALNIAKTPAQNVTNLNKLRSAQPVFTPTISVNTPPTDWTIAVSYTGGGLSTPQSIATDQAGNIWVANSGGTAGSVSKFGPSGAAISTGAGITTGGINVPYAIAIDQSGKAWVANMGNSSITVLSANGTSGTAYSNNGLSAPTSIAIDGNGNVFAGNSTSTNISGFTSSGTALAGSPFAASGNTSAIAINPR